MGSFMIFRHFRNLLAAAALLAAPLALAANDDAVLGAYDAYRAGDALKFARFAKKLDGHLLDPWIDYWRVAMRLEDTPTKDVHACREDRARLPGEGGLARRAHARRSRAPAQAPARPAAEEPRAPVGARSRGACALALRAQRARSRRQVAREPARVQAAGSRCALSLGPYRLRGGARTPSRCAQVVCACRH